MDALAPEQPPPQPGVVEKEKDTVTVEASGQQQAKNIQTVIRGYGQYKEYSQHFAEIESADTHTEYPPPWNEIKIDVDQHRRVADEVMAQFPPGTSAEQAGTQLFTERSRLEKPKGIVRAVQQGPYIVITADNKEDFMNLTGSTLLDNHQPLAGVSFNGFYLLDIGGHKVRREAFTVVALDSKDGKLGSIIDHEKEHHRLDMYTNAAHSERGVKLYDSRKKAINSLTKLNETPQSDIETVQQETQAALREFAQVQIYEAIEETVCVLRGSSRVDNYEPYTEAFDDLLTVQTLPKPVLSDVVNQVKKEFVSRVKEIKEVTNSALASFKRIEKDTDAAVGAVTMAFLEADAAMLDDVLRDISVITDIESGSVFTQTKGVVSTLYDKLIYEKYHLPEPLFEQGIALIQAFTAEVNRNNAHRAYAYPELRNSGKDIPAALTETGANHQQFVDSASAISLEARAIMAQIDDVIQAETVRDKLPTTQDTEKPPQPPPQPQIDSGPNDKVAGGGGLLNTLRNLFR